MVYLVERFLAQSVDASPDRLRRVRADDGLSVRLRGRLVVPADETEFWLFEGASMVEVVSTLVVFGLGGGRISQVEELTLFGPFDGDPPRQGPIAGFGGSA